VKVWLVAGAIAATALFALYREAAYQRREAEYQSRSKSMAIELAERQKEQQDAYLRELEDWLSKARQSEARFQALAADAERRGEAALASDIQTQANDYGSLVKQRSVEIGKLKNENAVTARDLGILKGRR
jgi:hypothetical protein